MLENLAHGIGALDVEAEGDAVSSTCVCAWLAEGDPRWRSLIPSIIADEVARIYKR